MTFYLVISIVYVCPGGIFGGLIPVAARQFVCKDAPAVEAYDRLELAQKKVVSLGEAAAPRLIQVNGLRLRDKTITWKTQAEF